MCKGEMKGNLKLAIVFICFLCYTRTSSDPTVLINRFGLDDPKVCQSERSRANFHYLTPNEVVYIHSHKHGTKSNFNKLLLKVLGRTRKKSTCSILLSPPYNYDNLQYLKIEFEEFKPSCDATLTIEETREDQEHNDRSSTVSFTCGSKPPDSYITSRGKKVFIRFSKSAEFTEFTFKLKVIATGFDERKETFSIGMKIVFGFLGLAGLIFVIGAVLQLASKCNSSFKRTKHQRRTNARVPNLSEEENGQTIGGEVFATVTDPVPPPYERCAEREIFVQRKSEEDVTNDTFLQPPSYEEAVRMASPQR